MSSTSLDAPGKGPVPSGSPSRVVTSCRLVVDLFLLIRPSQWAKNLIIVPAVLIDPALWSPDASMRVILSIIAFTLAAALVYLGNDIIDRHRDRHHPAKRLRPIADGRVTVTAAMLLGIVLAAAFTTLIVVGLRGRGWPVLAYLALNVAYSGGLKHVPLLDAGAVSAGFVLRVVQGYAVVGGPLPGWLLIAVFSGALLLIMGKRRRELLDSGVDHRPALRGYSVELADHLLQLTSVLAVIAVLFYLRSEAPLAPNGQVTMLVSAPFALFAVSRYLQLVLMRGDGIDPVRALLRDRVMVATTVLWALAITVTVISTRYLETNPIARP